MTDDLAAPASVPALRVRNVSVGFGRRVGEDPVVSGVSFDVAPGTCLAIVGESGSGKSVTARTLLGLSGPGSWVQADEITVAGKSVLGLSEREWRRRRGRDVGLVLQDALVSLDPLRPIGREVADSLRLHTTLGAAERARRVRALLASVGLPDPESKVRQRSGELSGGQRQRVLIASAIALAPPLLIADEPTTALDVTVQAQVLDLLEELKATGTALVLVSHDLAVVARIADQIAVMSGGRIVELGTADTVLRAPSHRETKRMLSAVPADKGRGVRLSAPEHPDAPPDVSQVSQGDAAPLALPVTTDERPTIAEPDGRPLAEQPYSSGKREVVLEASGLLKRFPRPGGGTHVAVKNVSFQLRRGETLGIVGESGSGKTTTARLALALTAPDAGEVRLLGEQFSGVPERRRRHLRSMLGAVYQDPLSSFDPRLTVGEVLGDAVRGEAAGASSTRSVHNRIDELLDSVHLPRVVLGRRPLVLSGGQRQRVSIARALASRPIVLVCDEPVSALDVTVQARVLDLLDELQRELALSLLFISHDLGVIQHVSDNVAVMQGGRIVETGQTRRVFDDPAHPYTRTLLSSVPRL
jgi:peptide/nickel transport system ATP-binding protein